MKRHKNTTYTNTSTVTIWIGPLGLDLPTTMALVSHYCLLVGKFIPKVDYKFKVFFKLYCNHVNRIMHCNRRYMSFCHEIVTSKTDIVFELSLLE